jgi:hypothetical protein
MPCRESQREPYSAIRHLAMALLMGRWRSELMGMFTAYFDGSGSSDTAALAVAGFVAPAEQWIEFERNWNDCLHAYGVTSLHMKHYAHSRGEFSDWKGDECKRRRFLERLISIIKTRVCHSFACAIVMSDYRSVDEEFCLREFANPYSFAAMTVIRKTLRWKEQRADQPEVLFVFEDGDEGQGDLKQRAKEFFKVTPHFLEKDKSVAFQAADLLAYEHLKLNVELCKSEDGKVFEDEVRRPLMALSAIPGGAHDGDWGIRAGDNLRNFCIECEISRRNV